MRLAKLSTYERALHLEPGPFGPMGPCPSCTDGVLTLRITGPETFEESCSNGCSPRSIREAVTRIVTEKTNGVNGERPAQETLTEGGIRPEGFTAKDLMGMHIDPARYAIDGYVCEGLNVFAGGQKKGKSWLAYSWAIAIASGGCAFGSIPVEKGSVLYLALEDGPRRLRDRLIALLNGAEAPANLHLYHRWPGADQGGIPAIEEWLKDHPDTRMVIIDTMGRFRGGRAKNGDVFQQDYDFGARLKRLADDHRLALVILHHLSKRQCDDPFDQVSGTIAVTASADATLLLQRQRGKDEATLFVTGRDVEEREMALLWTKETCAWTLAGSADEFKQSSQRKEIIELLQRMGALKPAAIADELGKNRSTTKNLLRKMLEHGEVHGDDGLYWAASVDPGV